MARKPLRRDNPLGELTTRQKWHLMRGHHFYSLSGFFHGRLQSPFASEEARRQAWQDHRQELIQEARQPLPESVKRELILRPKYCKPTTTWAFRPKPAAYYEYEENGGDNAVEDMTGPDGPVASTKSPDGDNPARTQTGNP